jgi:hypothetical protein
MARLSHVNMNRISDWNCFYIIECFMSIGLRIDICHGTKPKKTNNLKSFRAFL